ncbi:polysaccharide deacetylase family protein [Oryzihumus sp.]|uniref:polysaccharide deacetylase family protein n=1 Tax=Oryzihumus sp. TaxID=1968903 RepID=UPI002EDAA9AE
MGERPVSGAERATVATTPLPGTVRVLMYHSVSPAPAERGFRRYRVSPGLLDEHLSALAGAGLRGVSLTDLLEQARLGRDVSRLVALTFDDAFADFTDHALPLLGRHRAQATLYVPTAHVGQDAGWLGTRQGRLPLMDWPELRAAGASGVEIGSHGHWHRELDVLPAREVLAEARLSRTLLEDELGTAPQSLAYPFGYTTRAVRRAVHDAGFASACAVGYTTSPLPGLDPFAVQRLLVAPGTTPEQLADLLTGRQGVESTLRRWTRPAWRTARRVRHSLTGSSHVRAA